MSTARAVVRRYAGLSLMGALLAVGLAPTAQAAPPPRLFIDDVTVNEGDVGAVSATFTISLDGPSAFTVNVLWTTANGTATAPGDYVAVTNGSVSIPAGQLSRTITVQVNGDQLDEVNETFLVNIRKRGKGARIGDGQGVGTIVDDDLPPALSIDDVTLPEGTGGTTNFGFTVGLSAPSGQPVTVNFATANGTALAGSDYVAQSGTLTFSPGTTSLPLSVAVFADALSEPAETFFVNLTSPANATMADGQGVGTITDDDVVPTMSVNDVTVVEGNAGSVNAAFSVTLSAASGQAVTVDYATADVSAAAGSDYTATAGILTIPAGSTSGMIDVPVLGDVISEPFETFTLNLSSATNATIGDGQGTGTIADDDSGRVVFITDTSVTEGDGGTVNASFTVTITQTDAVDVTVNFATSDGTAAAPGDYVAATGTITFTPGQTTQTINVAVNGDFLSEASETFNVNLSNPSAGTAIADGVGVGTITDNDPMAALSIGDVSVGEGDTGTLNATFVVSLTPASGQTVTVNYATANGTAVNPLDYTATAGTLTFAAGVTSQNVTVAVVGDTTDEFDETFVVNLTASTNATISDSQGTGTIVDNDPPPTVSISDASGAEGDVGNTNLDFTLTLTQASGKPFTVDYATSNGTAVAGSDYVATSGTVTFAPGATTQTVSVPVIGDTTLEPNETFNVALSNAPIGDGLALGTILNDEDPLLEIEDATLVEGNAGTTNMVFNVILSDIVPTDVTVDFATADITATAGSDYTATSGTLTFPSGTTTLTIAVPVIGDTVGEPDETFAVNLTNGVGASIFDGQGIGTIADDDGGRVVFIDDVTVTEGDGGSVSADFTVTLSSPDLANVTVNFATADVTAVAPGDYTTAAGTLTFTPGQTTKTVSIAVIGDLLNESAETFSVNLSNAIGAGIADGQGTGTITDNDPAPALSISDVSVGEGDAGTINATFAVSLSAVSGQTVTVTYATADVTAVAPGDYTADSGTLIFFPGITSQNVIVAVVGDTTDEVDETFVVDLTAPLNASLADPQGTGTIVDDDIGISIADTVVVEGQTTANAVFTVTLSDPSVPDVTVTFATANITATAGSDYTTTSGTLTFTGGNTTLTITVPVIGDAVSEADETFAVNLGSPTGASISDGQGIGTIIDDDAGREVSHGSLFRDDLTAQPGPTADQDFFRISQRPYSSWEIVLDETSGDIGDIGDPASVSLLASNGTTVLAVSQPVGVGFAQSLRLRNDTAAVISDQIIGVQSEECTTTCGSEDRYRVRAYETTVRIPRFNNAGSQVTVLIVQNPTAASVGGTIYFWNGGGTLVASHTFSLGAKAALVLNTATVSGANGVSGTLTITHDGRYGELTGKAVALEPATGFSFDSPGLVIPR